MSTIAATLESTAQLPGEILVRATLLLGVVLLTLLALGTRRALLRSALGHGGIVALLALPWITAVAPSLPLPCLPPTGPSVAPPDRTAASFDGPSRGSPPSDGAMRAPGRSTTMQPSARGDEPTARGVKGSSSVAEMAVARSAGRRTDGTDRLARVLLVLYLIPLALLAVRLGLGLAGVARLRTLTRSARPEWKRALETWRSRLGVRTDVRVAVSPRIGVPVTIGWRRPVILLPPDLDDRGGDSLADTVLVHELAHVRRRDYGWQLLVRLAGALYWFHPLAWWLNRTIGRAREEACDDVCVHWLSAETYRSHLVDIARSAGPRPHGALGLTLLRSSSLESRLSRLERGYSAPRCVLSARRLCGLIAALLVTVTVVARVQPVRRAGATAVDTSEATPSEFGATRRVRIRVRDAETGAPIQSARVTWWCVGHIGKLLAGPNAEPGTWSVLAPRSAVEQLRIWVSADGYAPIVWTWEEGRDGERIPPVVTADLDRGVPIGGFVRDVAGRPIHAATVRLSLIGSSRRGGVEFLERPAVTDADGSWRAEFVPNAPNDLRIQVVHPEYEIGRPIVASAADFETLRAASFVAVLDESSLVEGTVIDTDGRPVTTATVARDMQPLPFDQYPDLGRAPVARTNARGSFRIHLPEQERRILVTAPRFSPALVAVERTSAPVAVRLSPERILHGRVLDSADRPVPGAVVELAAWRGTRIAGRRVVTNPTGEFALPGCPRDLITLRVARYGFVTATAVVPGDAEVASVRLSASTRVFGRVFDADTGRPVESFRAIRGFASSDGVEWQRERVVPFREGRYDVSFSLGGARPASVRIEADGYAPVRSPGYEPGSGPHRFDVHLTPSVVLRRRLLDPNGAPVRSTRVFVVSQQDRIDLSLNDVRPSRGVRRVPVDADGFFDVPADAPETRVIAIEPAGYASRSRAETAASVELSLEPWGAIEGEVRSGDAPHSRAAVRATLTSACGRIRTRARATSDAAGQFSFSRLPASDGFVAKLVRGAGFGETTSHDTPVDVRPGTVARPIIGEHGHELRGRLVTADGSNEPIGDGSRSSVTLIGSAERAGGRARRFATMARTDGEFRIANVPPGEYDLNLVPYDSTDASWPLGHHHRSVRFSSTDAELIDLGDIELAVTRRLHVGDEAPPLDATRPNGTRVHLAEFRGEPVVLYVWRSAGALCGPVGRRLDELWRAALGTPEEFVLIRLQLEDAAAQNGGLRRDPGSERLVHPKRILLTIPNAFASTTVRRYHASSVPHVDLIGPDGRFAARRVRIGQLSSRIAELTNVRAEANPRTERRSP